MTTDRDPRTRTVLSWLREDAHENAERVLLLALGEVDATPQRRSWWPARRFPIVNNTMRIGLTAAAVVVAGAAVGAILLSRDNVGGPLTPTSTPRATLAPTATAASRMPWPDGTYVAHVTAAEEEAARTLWGEGPPDSTGDVCPCDYSFEIRNGQGVGRTFSFAGDLVTFWDNGRQVSTLITVHWTFDGNQIVFSDMVAGNGGDRVVFLTKPFVKTD